MLVLTRKLGESIAIDDRITITVIALKGNQVKLGIDAPAETKVYRRRSTSRLWKPINKRRQRVSKTFSAMRALWPGAPRSETGRA